ncbi:MAG: 5-deoxy-glucuronate isomerase [Salinibacter sp.]
MVTNGPASPNLLIRPSDNADDDTRVTRVAADQADWDFLNMEVRHFAKGQTWSTETTEHEAALVLLGGRADVASNQGEWANIGARSDVFSGLPYALYLPRRTELTLTARTDGVEVAYGWVPTDEDHPAQLVTPEQCEIEVRGGHNATRQINGVIPPGFDCHRIVCVEVYTPGGNWSSFPPHKHDEHREDDRGNVLEAQLEEIYYYRVNKPNGYAVQRVYTDDRSLDAVHVAHDNDIVLVPEGYHPVSAAYGFDCYYLNFLAGSAQSLANFDDPDYAWIKETWTGQDPRVPLVTHGMTRDGR